MTRSRNSCGNRDVAEHTPRRADSHLSPRVDLTMRSFTAAEIDLSLIWMMQCVGSWSNTNIRCVPIVLVWRYAADIWRYRQLLVVIRQNRIALLYRTWKLEEGSRREPPRTLNSETFVQRLKLFAFSLDVVSVLPSQTYPVVTSSRPRQFFVSLGVSCGYTAILVPQTLKCGGGSLTVNSSRRTASTQNC